jgi:hypothetical protein
MGCEACGVSRLVQQLLALLDALRAQGVRHAAIGGVAVVAHGVVRATQDLDFLVDADDLPQVEQVMSSLGFRCLHKGPDAVNYVSADLRVDFLLARRAPTRELLASSRSLRAFDHDLPVVGVEGIIGLKLQALVNDPRRQQDLVDMRALMKVHRKDLDLERLRSYFRLFEREAMLEELLQEVDREAE